MWVRIILGVALVIFASMKLAWWPTIIVTLIGIVLAGTGVLRSCYLYTLLGANTNK